MEDAQRQWKVKAIELSDGGGYGPTPPAGDLELINSFALEPLRAEDVYVRRMRLANDRVDRDCERFSREILHQFAATLPGKSVLIGHQHRSAPVGRFYRAEVTLDERGAAWLVGYWYTPITPENEHQRKAIDSGIWAYVSLGYLWEWVQCDLCGEDYRSERCPHALGVSYSRGDLGAVTCTVTYRGKAEAIEGSIVYLGAQFDAEMVKAKLAELPVAGGGAAADRPLEEEGRGGRVKALEAENAALRGAVAEEAMRLAMTLRRDAELGALKASFGEGLERMPLAMLLDLQRQWQMQWDQERPAGRQSSGPRVAEAVGSGVRRELLLAGVMQ